MKQYIPLIVILAVIVLIILGIHHFGTRSGVTDAQVQEALPGDGILSDQWISIDRAATLPASAQVAWPWVEQLGKDRGGWYAPEWLENTLHEHSATTTIPAYQNLAVGDVIPDWGGGYLKVLAIDPDHYVEYGSQRTSATTTTNYNFIWTLVLENNTPTSTSFHLRLRLPAPTHGIGEFIPPSLPGMIDYATDVVMFAGLQEKLSY